MKNKIILFGAGFYGRQSFENLKEEYEIVCFADNNPKLAGTRLFGIPIISADKILEYWQQDLDVVICTEAYCQISEQLNIMGIKDYYVMLDGHLYHAGEHKKNQMRTCNRCVMNDLSDKTILFDKKGQCNYCTKAYDNIGKIYFPNAVGEEKLSCLIKEVKESGNGKKYDCIMGISGGLDSSYLAYLGYKWGLKVLAIHIDDGFDTEVSKSNLDKLIKATGFDYEVVRPDSTQFNALLLAYMKAGVPNIAIPQDNVLFAFLYKKMKEYNIKYFLSGGNFALESILQKGNLHSSYDITNILDIHKKYGNEPIDKLEFTSHKKLQKYKDELKIEIPRPLNYIDYNRERALAELNSFCGFAYYGQKHLENIWTAFTLLYWMPEKFHVDIRTSHLSSMIVSGQMTREEALAELKEPLYDEQMMRNYIDIIQKKLRLSDVELKEIMDAPVHWHSEYEAG